mmetsp:Transcript_5782/g.10242  ORF Transcript_5782/g.10242 Transcript_5782/m.10242 type:complete len:408 (-) Transcript_5782:48-1271(-)
MFAKPRKKKSDSAFVMFRTSSGVRVLHSRSLYDDTVREIIKEIEDCFILRSQRRPSDVFLDGPRHDEEKDLNKVYEYFCTSGGHPLPKNAQKDLYLWALDGWQEAEAIAAFVLLGRTREEAIDAYSVCGGCMGDMVAYVFGTAVDRATTMENLKALVNRVDETKIRLVMTTTSRSNDDDSGNPDRLRTMFNGESASDRLVNAIQIVDSTYVMQLLRGRLTLESYLKALKLGKAIRSGAVVGIFFEEVLHQWFRDSLPTGITRVCTSTGTGAEGVRQLREKGIYWIPCIPNFANIDAAVVIGRVLYVFHYTKRPDHSFNKDTFWQHFVTVVRGAVEFDRVHVYIVVMDGVSSTLDVNFTRAWMPPGPAQTRATATRFDISCTSTTVNIDTTSAETVRSSALSGFSLAE